jgi:hypothetical protein
MFLILQELAKSVNTDGRILICSGKRGTEPYMCKFRSLQVMALTKNNAEYSFFLNCESAD